jgi:5-methylcytosine-specific restriction protein B
MAIFCGSTSSIAAISAASDFKKKCLIDGASLFINEAIWTPEYIEELVVYFVENIDEGEGDFFSKLQTQLREASPQAKILASEMMWLMLICPSNIGAEASRKNIKQIFEFSGQQFSARVSPEIYNKYLNDEVLSGIGSAGTAYNTGRWRELCYLIRFAEKFLSLPLAERVALLDDYHNFSLWLEQLPENEKRQLRHMLLYLFFPEFHERIFGNTDRKEILTRCTDLTSAQFNKLKTREADQRLYKLRQDFENKFETKELDYYETEPLRSLWKGVITTSRVSEPKGGYSTMSETSESLITSLNQILYGPPGTGKTYSTINKALEIIDPNFLTENNTNRTVLKARFDSLVRANRVAFVTFHQSFSYEDFVEGIKASTNENNQVSYDVEDGIFKQMCDAASSRVKVESIDSKIDVANRQIWKMSLGNTLGDDAYIFEQCIEDNYLALGYGGLIDFSGANNREEIAALYRNSGVTIENESYDYNVTSVSYFKNYLKIGDLVIVSDGNHKFRAIAEVTSEYYFKENETGHYCQLRKVKWLKQFSPSLPVYEIFNKNLSQQTIYRLRPPTIDLDKLQGLLTNRTSDKQVSSGSTIANYKVISISNEIIELEKPNGSRLPIALSIINELVSLVKSNKITIDDIRSKKVFEKVDSKLEKYLVNGYPNVLAPLVDNIINKGISTHLANASDKRVLIIDEINRGNIASIFGELITLIEPSKRSGGDETITVKLPYSKTPFSVPSNLYLIGTMNTADKSLAQVDIALRRRFEFIEMMTNYDVLKDIPEINGIDIKRLVETINKRIELLYDREHTIGHSFFLPLKDEPTIEKLSSVFELQILPLLEEYFFEDWERVGQVLGDHLKSNNDLRFIIEKFTSSDMSKLMGDEWELSSIQPYVRNDSALVNPQAYIGIYEPIS